ncbi:MAG: radical SAM protein [Actinomycetota bacterium]
MLSETTLPLQFIFKVTARCNLNCTYCYVFNKADQSWRSRSPVMRDEVFEAGLNRVRRHCELSGQSIVRVMFHGGEPLLAGVPRFRRWLERIESELAPFIPVSLAIQTNATLITKEWAKLFAEHKVEVGVSVDGPPELNDLFRVDHAGRGSYANIVRGIGLLQEEKVPYSILSVIPLGADGLAIYRHFRSLKPGTINFLLPDHTHDDIAETRRAHGPTPVADFMIPIADEWYAQGMEGADVPLIRNMCRLILGGETRSDMFGNPPLGFVFIEVDGEIEGLDVLRADEEGMASIGLNVLNHHFTEIASSSPFHQQVIFQGVAMPTACVTCPESLTCTGGYLPHRYSQARGFDNPSAWCADLLRLFQHLRGLLGVDVEETRLRRAVLADLAVAA